MTIRPAAPRTVGWQTPALIVICGCLIGAISFGPRSALGYTIWWLSVFFGVASALINLPIVEKPVQRPAPLPG